MRYYYITVTTADPERMLSELSMIGISLRDIVRTAPLTVTIKIKENGYPKVIHFLQKSECKYTLVKSGFIWRLENLFARPLLMVGVLLFFIMTIVLPGRIFRIKVCGNELISEQSILAEAERCGIGFFCKSAEIRSEDVKNQLLTCFPALQWVGITTEGCTAMIEVAERSETEETDNSTNLVSNIIAKRDGVITQQTVYRGNLLTRVGQMVEKGETLISAYTDCGSFLRAEAADGEIFGYTQRESIVIAPRVSEGRGEMTHTHSCYRIQIGKKVINLCNHSGILDSGCVKIYSQNYWTLPGGFQLPVSITRIEQISYAPCGDADHSLDAYQWLSAFAREHLCEQMVAGEIIQEDLRWKLSDDACVLIGEYACHEMIGQVKYEENVDQNAEDN